MGVRKDVNQLAPLEVVEMFVLDMTVIGGADVLRWHPGTTAVTLGPIVWQGQTYQPFPVIADGFEITSIGKMPRPTLKVSNIGGAIGAYIRQFNDALGAKLTRKRTLGKYLDAANFSGGNPNANPSAHFPDEIWFIARKASENPIYAEIELAAPFDVEGVFLPRRQVIAGTCSWIYRSVECTYAGAPVMNDPIYPGQDKCSKSLAACRARFGQNGVLPTSAFPASLLTRTV